MSKWGKDDERFKDFRRKCPACNGRGTVYLDDINPGRARNERTCRDCGGTGEV